MTLNIGLFPPRKKPVRNEPREGENREAPMSIFERIRKRFTLNES